MRIPVGLSNDFKFKLQDCYVQIDRVSQSHKQHQITGFQLPDRSKSEVGGPLVNPTERMWSACYQMCILLPNETMLYL